jgi:hypothetical protein
VPTENIIFVNAEVFSPKDGFIAYEITKEMAVPYLIGNRNVQKNMDQVKDCYGVLLDQFNIQ